MSSLSEVFATRAWFAADLVRDLEPGVAELRLRPGSARVVTIWRSTGLPFDQRSDPDAVLDPAAGDVLIVCGPATDEIAAAVVEAVGPPLRVRLGAGLAAGTAVRVTVTSAHGLRTKTKRTRAAKPRTRKGDGNACAK